MHQKFRERSIRPEYTQKFLRDKAAVIAEQEKLEMRAKYNRDYHSVSSPEKVTPINSQ